VGGPTRRLATFSPSRPRRPVTVTRALFVVPCSSKLAHRAPARLLYTGTTFRLALRVVEREAALTAEPGLPTSVLIMSARHGLITPDTVIDPYEQTMTDGGSIPVSSLVTQLMHRAMSRTDIYAFLPKLYRTRLRAAADLLGHITDFTVLVHDVYEAAPGIGYQRQVLAAIRRSQPSPPQAEAGMPDTAFGSADSHSPLPTEVLMTTTALAVRFSHALPEHTAPGPYPQLILLPEGTTLAQLEDALDTVLDRDLGSPRVIYADIDDHLDDSGPHAVVLGDDHLFCLTCEAQGLLEISYVGDHPAARRIERWHNSL
jgi:hypothetical protein